MRLLCVCVCVCVRACVPAHAADEALGVVRASQSGDHLSRDKAVTAVAACAVQTLVVRRTDVLALLLEEARPSQVTVTHCRGGEQVRGSQGSGHAKHKSNMEQDVNGKGPWSLLRLVSCLFFKPVCMCMCACLGCVYVCLHT